MKYCKFCGKEIEDNTEVCPNCGGNQNGEGNNNSSASETGKVQKELNDLSDGIRKGVEDKPVKGGILGFVLTFFLGLIGFIICLILGDPKCKKAAIITFIVDIALYILLIVFMVVAGVAGAAAVENAASAMVVLGL